MLTAGTDAIPPIMAILVPQGWATIIRTTVIPAIIIAELRLFVNFQVRTAVTAPKKSRRSGDFQPLMFLPIFTITDGIKRIIASFAISAVWN